MLLDNKTLDAIIEGRISVVFRIWKRATVKTGGTLRTRKGLLSIEEVRQTNTTEISEFDMRQAGISEIAEIGQTDRTGDLYLIRVRFAGEDPRIAKRTDLNEPELLAIAERLRKTGEWTTEYLALISELPNTHAQILADRVGLEKLKFKARVRRLKEHGLTISLRPGYRLSPRGEKILAMLIAFRDLPQPS